MFLANYGDTLTDAPLDRLVEDFRAARRGGVPGGAADELPVSGREPTGDERVRALVRPGDADLWINGGYFLLRREIFDDIQPGDELVEEPFARLDRGGAPARDAVRGVLGADGHAARRRAARGACGGGRPPWVADGPAQVGPAPTSQRRGAE